MFHHNDIQRKTGDHIRKFGSAIDVDKAEAPIDVWSYSDQLASYVFPSDSGEALFISSSNASDTVSIEVQGLDENFNPKTQEITLQGRTKLSLDGLWSRVFRAFNTNNTNLLGDVYVYTDSTVSNGVPQTDANVKAIINLGNDQTTMAIYTVPAGKNLHLSQYHVSIDAKASVGAFATMSLDVRQYGKSFRSREIVAVSSNAPSIISFDTPFTITGKSDIKLSIKQISSNSVDVHAVFQGTLL